jgi:hypothetical protein
MIFLEAACLASRSPLVDSVLGQTMPKLPIEGFDYLRSRRRGWYRCWVPSLLRRWGGSPCCRVMCWTGRALKHPYSFQYQVSQVSHIERAFAPCVVLVINDNPYGLMFALSFICRSCP